MNGYCDTPTWDEETERRKLLFDIELHRPLDSPADVNADGSLKKRILVESNSTSQASVTVLSSLSISIQPRFEQPQGAYIPVARFGNPNATATDLFSVSSKICLLMTHVIPAYDVEFKSSTSLLAMGAAKLESSATFAISAASSSSSRVRARALSHQNVQRPICNSWDSDRCNVPSSATDMCAELPTRCVCVSVNIRDLQQFQGLAAHLEALQQMDTDAVIRIESRSYLLPLEQVVSFFELCCDWNPSAAETIPAVNLYAAAHAFGHPKSLAFARRRLLEGSGVPMTALPDVLLLSHQTNDIEVIGHCFLACECFVNVLALIT
jgi:hypothetical protein